MQIDKFFNKLKVAIYKANKKGKRRMLDVSKEIFKKNIENINYINIVNEYIINNKITNDEENMFRSEAYKFLITGTTSVRLDISLDEYSKLSKEVHTV